MRFVERKIGRCQKRKTNRRQRGDKEPDCSRSAHVAPCSVRALPFESASKLGWRANTAGIHFRAAVLHINSKTPSRNNASAIPRKSVATTSLGQCAPR